VLTSTTEKLRNSGLAVVVVGVNDFETLLFRINVWVYSTYQYVGFMGYTKGGN